MFDKVVREIYQKAENGISLRNLKEKKKRKGRRQNWISSVVIITNKECSTVAAETIEEAKKAKAQATKNANVDADLIAMLIKL